MMDADDDSAEQDSAPGHELTLEETLPGDAYSAQIMTPAHLTVLSGPLVGKTFPLLSREIVIGRSPGVHVRLDEAAISGSHARIQRRAEHYQIVDLGSRNGTFVNGKRLSAGDVATLSPGDSIRVADIELAFEPVANPVPQPQLPLARLGTHPIMTSGLRYPEAELLAQILQSAAPPPVELKREPSLEATIAKVMAVLAILRRQWVPLFAAVTLCALAGGIWALRNPPPSEATARIRITPWTPTDNPLQQSSAVDPEEFYSAAREVFMSPLLIQRSLVKVGVRDPSSEQVSDTLAELSYKGATTPTYGSPVSIYITAFLHPSADFAERFLARHLETFFESQIAQTLHVTQAEVEFLSVRVKDSEVELRRIEKELKEFKDQNLEGLPEYTQGLIVSRESLIARRVQLSGEMQRASSGLSEASKTLSEETPLLARRAERSQAFEQPLVEAKRRLAEARAKGLGDQHPEVVSLRKQVDELERLAAQARASRTTDFDRSSDLALAELRHREGDYKVASAAAGAELAEINKQLARIDGIVNKMPEVEARYAQLTRSYASTRDLHTKLFEKLKSSQLQLDLERTSAKARYQVTVPAAVAPPKLGRTVTMKTLMGAGVGLALGLVIVAFREMRRLLVARRVKSTAIVPVRRESGSIRPI